MAAKILVLAVAIVGGMVICGLCGIFSGVRNALYSPNNGLKKWQIACYDLFYMIAGGTFALAYHGDITGIIIWVVFLFTLAIVGKHATVNKIIRSSVSKWQIRVYQLCRLAWGGAVIYAWSSLWRVLLSQMGQKS